ncbi:MAG TPA: YciI family protein [Myxococcota bacterium]|nr:YciI family protein [Myxococcota bacterium]
MPRFLLLLSPEHRAGGELSAAELGLRTLRFVAWLESLRQQGALRDGGRLEPRSDRVRCEGDGTRVIAGETGAAVGLYFVVEAADRDAALAWAARCPGAEPGAIDVYRVDAETGSPAASP